MDNKKIIVALDGMNRNDAVKIAKILRGKVWGFKVNDLLYNNGSIVTQLKKYGKVFADAKLHDIPNTVANSVKKLSKAGADIITVHASGGIEMMKAAKINSGKSKIIAVTVLTSTKLNSSKQVLNLVKDAMKASMDGLVCSGKEVNALKRLTGTRSMIKVVPGIRPNTYKTKDDQKRIVTPTEALKLGADLLVIGRPITSGKFQKKIF